MNKVERQQKKLEAMREREEKKRLKKEEKRQARELKKAERPGGKKEGKRIPNLRPERKWKTNEPTELVQKNTHWKKIVAILLWVVIAFFTLQGILSVMNRESSESIIKNANKHYAELTEMERIQVEAGTYVSSFLREFFTYGDDDRWAERVGKYLASGVAIDEPNGTDHESVLAVDIRKIDVQDKQIDVDAYVDIAYSTEKTEGDKKIIKEGASKHLVRVPVMYDGENYAIMGAPIYISDVNKAENLNGYDDIEGGDVSDEAKSAVETTAGNFLKAYYGKKPSELKYFVTKDFGSIVTAGKNLSFVKVDECEVVKTRGGYLAMVKATIDNGFGTFDEVVYLTLVPGDENRLYVEKMQTHP